MKLIFTFKKPYLMNKYCIFFSKPLDKNVIYSFLCSFKDIELNNKFACQRLVDMFLNRVFLFDDHCDIYFNTNYDKPKQFKLKEQPDPDNKILFKSNKKEQSNRAGSDCSLMAGVRN